MNILIRFIRKYSFKEQMFIGFLFFIIFTVIVIFLRLLGPIYGNTAWIFSFSYLLLIPFFFGKKYGVLFGFLLGLMNTITIILNRPSIQIVLSKPDTLDFWLYIITSLLFILVTSYFGYLLGSIRISILSEEITMKNLRYKNKLLHETEETLVTSFLSIVIEVTQSKFAFVGEINQDGLLETISFAISSYEDNTILKYKTKNLFSDSKIPKIFEQVLKDEKSLIINFNIPYPNDSVVISEYLPKFHTFLGVPLIYEGKTIGMVALANKESKYDQRDKEIVESLSVSFVEILKKKRLEKVLIESEEKYRNLVERANDGVMVIQDKYMKYINPSLAKSLEYTTEEILETLYTNYIHDDVLSQIVDRYERRIAGQDVIPRYETIFKKKDGSPLNVEINTGLVPYKGKPADLVLVRDISEQKRYEKKLQSERENLLSILNTITDGVNIVDKDHNIEFVNLTLAEEYGSVEGKKCYQYFHNNSTSKASYFFLFILSFV